MASALDNQNQINEFEQTNYLNQGFKYHGMGPPHTWDGGQSEHSGPRSAEPVPIPIPVGYRYDTVPNWHAIFLFFLKLFYVFFIDNLMY